MGGRPSARAGRRWAEQTTICWAPRKTAAEMWRSVEASLLWVIERRGAMVIDVGDASDPRGPRYVQAAVEESGVTLETVSNHHLALMGAVALTDADCDALRRMGWRAPDETCTNHHRSLELAPGVEKLGTDLLARTLVSIHGWTPAIWLSIDLLDC